MKLGLFILFAAFFLRAGAQEFNLSFQYTAASSAQFDPANAPPTQGSAVNTAVSYWNTIDAGGQSSGNIFGPVELASSDSSYSGVTASGIAGYCWSNGISPTAHTKDWVMMDSWFGFNDAEFLTITGIPETLQTNGYTVIIYGDSNQTNRTMTYTLSGDTKTIQDTGTFSGSFSEGTNIAIFSGLHASSFSITGNQSANYPGRSAVNGLRILPDPPVPEIISFSADRRYVESGDTVTLHWQVKNADAIRLDPVLDNAIPFTTNGTGSSSFPVTANTKFTLTVRREDDDTSASTAFTVRVGSRPPNFLLFVVDDMGWQDTSLPFNYSADGSAIISPLNSRYRTPSMERLAADGMLFTAAYANTVCSPSRASIMTGKSSARHHVTNWTTVDGTEPSGSNSADLKPPSQWLRTGMAPCETNTLPRLLSQQAGYRTIHVGKAHFGSIGSYAQFPQNIGFDVNIAGSEIGHPASYYGTNSFGTGSNHVPGLEQYHGQDIFLTEALTLEMNKQIASAVDDGIPFFAYMSHYAVHAPWNQDNRFVSNYPGLTGSQLGFATLIEGMDKSLGDILDHLQTLGVADDTLVVFISDNGGDNVNTPLRSKKGTLYEGGLRVPMIWAWAKTNAANQFQSALPIVHGSRQSDNVLVWDIYSTLLNIAGVTNTPPVDSEDLSGYLKNVSGYHRNQKFAIHFPHYRSPQNPGSVWRDGDWKLIYDYQTGISELYNLADDLSETNNLSGTQPERVMGMTRALARNLNELGALFSEYTTNSEPVPPAMPDLPGIDLDGDGVADLQEDANRNGLCDKNETDPDNIDTDGDRTPDGAEIALGINPLDPASAFRTTASLEAGCLRIAWPSRPGSFFRLEYTSNITESVWYIAADNIPADAGTNTAQNISNIINRTTFYRTLLK